MINEGMVKRMSEGVGIVGVKKRVNSTYTKKDLTLEVEEIEKDNEKHLKEKTSAFKRETVG